MAKTFRFKFTEPVMDAIAAFSKIHEYDNRKDYKEAWNKWLDENDEIIEREQRRLLDMGYNGDILDKMYKAGRYYFRTKTNDKPEPKQRREYISMDTDIIDAMDEHIISKINENNFKPSTGYDNFCKEHYKILAVVIKQLCQDNPEISASDISIKIKKTYKNRYFIKTQNQLNKEVNNQ